MRINDTGGGTPLSGIRLYIGVPTRDQRCFVEFAGSLAETMTKLVILGAEVRVQEHHNSCFPDVARNQIVNGFMESGCTHLLMIDDDMGWTPDSVTQMLLKDKEFIAGAGPFKKDDLEFAVTFVDGQKDGLLMAEKVGGAFTIHKRVVFERMMEKYPDLVCLSHGPTYGYSFYDSKHTTNEWISEDYMFCRRWLGIGGEIFIYPDIGFTHHGYKIWKGHLSKEIEKHIPNEQLKQLTGA